MIRLRPYKRCDAQYITSWIKDEYSFRQWCADRYDCYPIDEIMMNNQYDDMAESDSFFEMTAFDDTGVVGHLIMRFTDDNKETLRFGFVIVDNTKRGQGYGKEMLKLAVKYSFEILKVNKITLGVFENNKRAYECYKSVGFKEIKEEQRWSCKFFNEDWPCIEMELLGTDTQQ